MLKLADLQAGFAAALLDPARPAPQTLRRQAALSQSRRFDVYRNNRMAGLVAALESAFPAVQQLVGADFFKAAARTYIQAAPPGSPVLLLYGETFGDFLDDFAPAAGVPYLGDVARLEWARRHAYHAGDAEPLSIARLSEVPQALLAATRFALHPSLRLLRSRFPVVSLWAACSGTDPGAEVDMTRGEAAAVLRPALSVEVRLLPPGGYAFMARLAAGGSLASAAEAALADVADFDLASHLRGLFQLGAVVAVLPPEQDPQQAQTTP